jgi:hypothetical protein
MMQGNGALVTAFLIVSLKSPSLPGFIVDVAICMILSDIAISFRVKRVQLEIG